MNVSHSCAGVRVEIAQRLDSKETGPAQTNLMLLTKNVTVCPEYVRLKGITV